MCVYKQKTAYCVRISDCSSDVCSSDLHFKGSRAIAAWFHYAFGLERNTQHDDPEMRKYSTFRCVKGRYTGRANGNTMCLKFDQETAQLQESDRSEERRVGKECDRTCNTRRRPLT